MGGGSDDTTDVVKHINNNSNTYLIVFVDRFVRVSFSILIKLLSFNKFFGSKFKVEKNIMQ
jgi:hypothetical protein